MRKAGIDEILNKTIDALNSCTEERKPSEELKTLGTALVEMGKAMEGVCLEDAKRVFRTILVMHQNGLIPPKEKTEKPKAKADAKA